MADEKRIRDCVDWGSAADVKGQMEDLIKVSLRCCEWIKASVERTERSLKHAVPEKTKLARTDDIAKSVGLEVEHKAFFKLFSKRVHPSSYLPETQYAGSQVSPA